MVEHTAKSVKQKYRNAAILNFEDRLLNAKEWMFSQKELKKKQEASEMNLHISEQEERMAGCYSLYIIASSVIFSLFVFSFYYESTLLYKALSLNLAAISLVCLYAGIFTPILEISAFNDNLVIPLKVEMKELPLLKSIPWFSHQEIDLSKKFEGRMYYFYQNKSIVEIIILLFKDGNIVVGFAILCFSVLMPLSKLSLSLYILLSDRVGNRDWLPVVVTTMAKWSMADVFVVASYLSYLSFTNMNSGVDTEAKTMIGLYYFFAFVVLSISTTLLTTHTIKKDKDC